MELQLIQNKIHTIWRHRVMIDFDLAEMYGVDTRSLKQAVKRNEKRFPHDFMFELTKTEWDSLISQNGISKRGGNRFSPYAGYQPAVQRNLPGFAGIGGKKVTPQKSSRIFGRQ